MSVWETSLNVIFNDSNFYSVCTYIRNGADLSSGSVIRVVFSSPTEKGAFALDTMGSAQVGNFLFRASDFDNPPAIGDVIIIGDIFDEEGNVNHAVSDNAMQYRLEGSPSLDGVQVAWKVNAELLMADDRVK